MDRFNGRENVLLGVTPQTQRVFHSASSSSQGIVSPRNSDIDFNDVFGGPPRRFSTQETRYSFGEAVDSCGQEDDDKAVSRRPWSSSTEKPVFGDENVNRRRYQTGDFFDDIFRGDESSYSSPRRTERDLLSSAPGSRISSPARSLPPKIEPFGTSLPAQISLPAKLSKAGDFPLFASGKGESYSLSLGASSPSRFSSQGHDIRPRHRQSPLSNEYSHSGEESINMIKSDERDLRRKSTEDFKVMDIQDNCNQFHFSIYKWAGRGVPLLMPFRGVTSSKSKEKAKIKRCSSSNERIVSHGVVSEVPISGIHDTDKLTIQGEKKENASTRARENRRQTVEEAVSAMPDFKSIVENVLGNASFSNRREKIKPLPEKEVSSIDQEALKPERMPQTSLLNDEIKEKGENRPELNKASFQGSSMEAGDIHVRSRVKSKVKDFVKIFNQEASSSEPKIKAKTGSQSFRWKGTTNAANREESFSTTKMDKEVHTPFSMEDKNIESEKQNFRGKSTVDTISDDFSGQNDAPSFGESFPDGSGVGNADNTFQANFLIRELSPDMDKVVQTGEDYEDFHVLDAKIKKWSNGKKGNIRSLLSTLQYVLWAESGWKPVPLVSIVEGNGVKRAYQKALLCLHPDKLQQKSAASHQKYIAEKVFDILQEAWEQFNSLDSPF